MVQITYLHWWKQQSHFLFWKCWIHKQFLLKLQTNQSLHAAQYKCRNVVYRSETRIVFLFVHLLKYQFVGNKTLKTSKFNKSENFKLSFIIIIKQKQAIRHIFCKIKCLPNSKQQIVWKRITLHSPRATTWETLKWLPLQSIV